MHPSEFTCTPEREFNFEDLRQLRLRIAEVQVAKELKQTKWILIGFWTPAVATLVITFCYAATHGWLH